MRRYISAAKLFHEWSEREKQATYFRKKWEKKLKYYRKAFEQDPN